MKKVIEIIKIILMILGSIFILGLVFIIFWRINAKNSNNTLFDDFGFSNISDNSRRNSEQFNERIDNISNLNSGIRTELDGQRDDCEQLNKSNNKDRSTIEQLRGVHSRLEKLIRRITDEGITGN